MSNLIVTRPVAQCTVCRSDALLGERFGPVSICRACLESVDLEQLSGLLDRQGIAFDQWHGGTMDDAQLMTCPLCQRERWIGTSAVYCETGLSGVQQLDVQTRNRLLRSYPTRKARTPSKTMTNPQRPKPLANQPLYSERSEMLGELYHMSSPCYRCGCSDGGHGLFLREQQGLYVCRACLDKRLEHAEQVYQFRTERKRDDNR